MKKIIFILLVLLVAVSPICHIIPTVASSGAAPSMYWSVPKSISDGFIKWKPSLIQDSNGNFRCAFDGQDIGPSRIFWVIYSNGSWSSPQAITVGRDGGPSLIQDSAGKYQLAFCRWNGDTNQGMWDIYWTSNSGNGWSNPMRLTDYVDNDFDPSIMEDSNGDLQIVFERTIWYGNRGVSHLYWMTYHGGKWSTPIAITDITNADTGEYTPSIIQDSSGDLVIAYATYSFNGNHICLMRYNNGTWSSPSVIFSCAYDEHPEGLSLVKAIDGSLWLSFAYRYGELEKEHSGIRVMTNQSGTWSAPSWALYPELNIWNMNTSMIQDSEGNLRISFRHSWGGIYWITSTESPPPDLYPTEYQWSTIHTPKYKWDPYPKTFKSWQQVRFMNSGTGIAKNVTATITSAPASVTIADGVISLGNIPAGGSAWSTDDFALVVDMTNPQDPKLGIVWKVEYDDENGNHHVIENVPQLPPK